MQRIGHRRTIPSGLALVAALALVAVAAPPAAADHLRWVKQFGTTEGDSARGVAATSSGTYVAGQTSGTFAGQASAGMTDGFVRKYDANGNEVWTRQFGTSQDEDVHGVAAAASGIYVVGATDGGTFPGETPAGGMDAFVRKYDAAGNEVWTRQFGAPDELSARHDRARAVAATSSGIYVVGDTTGEFPPHESAGQTDAFVRKYDADGNEVWTRQFGSAVHDQALGVAADASGIYVVGAADGSLPGHVSAGAADAFLRKYDADGNLIWSRQFGTAQSEWASGVTAASSGIYVVGTTEGAFPGNDSAGQNDAFVRRYDADGNEFWTRQFGSDSFDDGAGVAAGPTGIYVVGHTEGALPGQEPLGETEDAFVRKYDAAGKEVWTRQFGTSDDDFGRAVAAASSGVYTVGSTAGTLPGNDSAGGYDAFAVRFVHYRPDGLISKARTTGYVGNDVYNTTGKNQTRSATVRRGKAKAFFIRGQNDGDTTDTFRAKGCKSGGGFTVTYLAGATGSTNITKKVVAGTYELKNVAPGEQKTFRARIRVGKKAKIGAVKACKVVLTSKGDPTKKDAVRAKVKAKR